MTAFRWTANIILMLGLLAFAGCGDTRPPDTATKVEATDVQDESNVPDLPAEETEPAAEEPEKPSGSAPKAGEAMPAETEPAETEPDTEATAEPEAAAPETEAPAEPEAAADAGKTFVISANDRSEIAFTGYKPTGSRQGGFGNFTGAIDMPNDVTSITARATIDVNTLYTDANALTGVLKGEGFFHVEEHPKAEVVVTKVEAQADGEPYLVTGNLTLRGNKHGVQFPASIEETDKGLKIGAEFTIDRSQWGMDRSWEDQFIKNEVLINLDLLATPKG